MHGDLGVYDFTHIACVMVIFSPNKLDMAMDQYLLIPFLVGWTSIYQLFWGSLGTRVLTHPHMDTKEWPIVCGLNFTPMTWSDHRVERLDPEKPVPWLKWRDLISKNVYIYIYELMVYYI